MTQVEATATYHIYLDDKCLFKNLDEATFDLIWDKIYYSYWTDQLSYAVCFNETCFKDGTNYEEHSY